MEERLEKSRALYQSHVVHEIEWRFGSEHVYTNKNGNLAIDKDVLEKFKEITLGQVMWEPGERYWRPKLPHEPDGVRQAE